MIHVYHGLGRSASARRSWPVQILIAISRHSRYDAEIDSFTPNQTPLAASKGRGFF